MRILIAEEDPALANFVVKGLEAEHYAVDSSGDGEQARAMATEFEYDLVVLDLNLPRLDGVAILRHVRSKKASLPILILTARSRVEDRVLCLDAGADDYMVKPFSFSELSARIRALLRRSHLAAGSKLVVDDLTLDRVERRVERCGRRVELTSKEFALLEYLMRNAGHRMTRNMIIEHVWNLSFDSATNVVDVYINYLSTAFQAALVSAEHLSYRDFLQRMPEVTYLASCRLDPLGVNAVLQLDLSIAFPIVDLLLGGKGHGETLSREITEIEEQILESVVRIICRELGLTWQSLALEFCFEQRQKSAQIPHLLALDEKTLALSFEITMPDTRGTLNLAVPIVVSNALLRKISADSAYQMPRRSDGSKEQLRKRLLECPFQLGAEVLNISVPLHAMLHLSPGDLLLLPRRADATATLRVGGIPMFSALVVRHGLTRAAQIVERQRQDLSERKDLPK